jgi:hypothetical protein
VEDEFVVTMRSGAGNKENIKSVFVISAVDGAADIVTVSSRVAERSIAAGNRKEANVTGVANDVKNDEVHSRGTPAITWPVQAWGRRTAGDSTGE